MLYELSGVGYDICCIFIAEVRQEAVQQALAQAMQNRHKPSLPMPSKRTSVMARSPDRDRHDSGKFQFSNKIAYIRIGRYRTLP